MYQPSTDSAPPISELLSQRTEAALSELIQFYRPLLTAVVNRELDSTLRMKVGASDIVQEACCELAQRFESVRAKCRYQFWTYLHLLIRHKLQNARRFYLLAQRRDGRREVHFNGGDVGQPIRVSPQPEDDLVAQEELRRLKGAVARLPEELQLLLHWRFSENMSYKDIGQLVARSPDDVRMLINRCLVRLRTRLQRYDE